MCARVQSLVAKPDQLIKRRGKLGLVKVKLDLEGAKKWISEKMNTTLKVCRPYPAPACLCVLCFGFFSQAQAMSQPHT